MDSTVRVLFLGDASSAVRSVSRLSSSFGGLGRAMSTAAKIGGVAIIGALAGAVKAAVDFDKAMRNVNSIAKLSEGQFKAVSKQVLALAKVTAQSPKTLAAGLYDIVSSGFDATQGLKILKAAATAATAGLTDTATSTKAVVAVLNAYHMSADDAAKVSDVLFQTVNKGVLTFAELASQIGDVLPVASNLKVPLADIGGALATITLHGVSAAEASTQLKQLLTSMLKPSTDLKKEFHDMGFESGEVALKALGLQGVLARLTTDAKGSTKAFADWFPNVRAMNGALGLTGKNTKTLDDNLKAMRNSSGAADAAFKEQSKSISVQWQKAKASITAAAIPIGQLLFPLLVKAAEKVGDFARAIQSRMPEIKAAFHEVATVVGDVGGAIGRVVASPAGSAGIFGVLAAAGTAKSIISVRSAISGLGGFLTKLGPAGTVAAVAIGLVAAAFIMATRQGALFESQLRGIDDALHNRRKAEADAAASSRILAQATLNEKTSLSQMHSAQELANKAVHEFGPKAQQARDALYNLKQAQINHTNALADGRVAQAQYNQTQAGAKKANKDVAASIAELQAKAAGMVKSMQAIAAGNIAAAQSGNESARAAYAQARAMQTANLVDAYAAAIQKLARLLGVGAGRSRDFANAVNVLTGYLGRLPSFKEINIYVKTHYLSYGSSPRQGSTGGTYPKPPERPGPTRRAMGGFIPGATGKAVPIVAHSGEVVLNPQQQMMLGGPRAIAKMFGFGGERGPAFAAGGFVGDRSGLNLAPLGMLSAALGGMGVGAGPSFYDPGGTSVPAGGKPGKPSIKAKRSKRSPWHPLRPRPGLRSASAAVNAALAGLEDIDLREQVKDRQYGQLVRDFDISQEVFLVDVTDADGNTTQVLDQAAVDQRLHEIDSLIGARGQMLGLLDEEKRRLQKALNVLKAAVRKLVAAIKDEQRQAAEDQREIDKLTRMIAARTKKVEADRHLIAKNLQAIATDRERIAAERKKAHPDKGLIAKLTEDIDRRQDQNRHLHVEVHDLLVSNTQDRKRVETGKKSKAAHLTQAKTLAGEREQFLTSEKDVGHNLTDFLPLDRRDVELDIKELNAQRVEIGGIRAPVDTSGGAGGDAGAGGDTSGVGGGGGAGDRGVPGAGAADLRALRASLQAALDAEFDPGRRELLLTALGQMDRQLERRRRQYPDLLARLLGEVADLRYNVAVEKAQLPIIGAFQRGTLHVPQTGLALLHAGEQVLTRDQGRGRSGIHPGVDNAQPVEVHLNFANGMDWLRDFVSTEVVQGADRISAVQGRTTDRWRREGRGS